MTDNINNNREDPNSLRRRLDNVLMDGLADHRQQIASIHTMVTDFSSRIIRIEEKLNHTEQNIAAQAANIAVSEVFERIGVDVNDVQDLTRFRADLQFSTALRDISKRGAWMLLTGLTGIIGTLVWIFISERLGIKP